MLFLLLILLYSHCLYMFVNINLKTSAILYCYRSSFCLFQEIRFFQIRTKSIIGANCNYVHENFLSAEVPVAVCFGADGEPISKLHVVMYILESGTDLKDIKVSEDYSNSKSRQRIRKRQKDPKYGHRENQ